MYLKKIFIRNIRSISELTWQVEAKQAAGWHVILGDNGAGKTTFVRAIAIALIGPSNVFALRLNLNTWLRLNKYFGQIGVELLSDGEYDSFASPARIQPLLPLKQITDAVRRNGDSDDVMPRLKGLSAAMLFFRTSGDDDITSTSNVILGWGSKEQKHKELQHVWGDNKGWFSASYGPFRRFSGGDQDQWEDLQDKTKLARHLTLFGEDVALTEPIRWLKDLWFAQLEDEDAPEGRLLEAVKHFINHQDFLPNQVRIKTVSRKVVEFVDSNDCLIPVEELSDGYRSILSMTLELLRQLALCYGMDRLFNPDDPTRVVVPGVVLIDEVDVHLHPTWQRRIGVWFREHFPNIQFIVTTHSPLVCQAATHGTVFKLPTPGTEEQGRMITGVELNRLLYGNILDAYSTGAFGQEVGRSEEGEQRMERLAELNIKELDGLLSKEEQSEQEQLRAMLPTTAHTLKFKVAGGV